MTLELYDEESLSNLFTYTGYCPKEDKYYQFCICGWRNDLDALMAHLFRDKLLQVGFNNNAYDYPLLHHIINHYEEYKLMSGSLVAQSIYQKSQEIIDMEFSEIAEKNRYIKQIDLYKIWHYNNKARTQNLKGLEIAMRMENVEEMPLHHSHWCVQGEEEMVLRYNKNDVLATYKFFLVTLGKTDYPIYQGKNKMELRNSINKQFNVNVTNLGDVPMGYELILQLYSRAIGESPYIVKKRHTIRNQIKLSDCIPSWCNIKSKEFNKFLDMIKSTTIKGEKGEFSYSVIFHGYKFDFGLGGSHGCCKPGVYQSDDYWVILDYDVGSLYPSIAKSLRLYPEHLGPIFMELYEDFIQKRLEEKHKPKAERNMALIEGYKLVLNGVYGKSNEESSFLYDPLYTFRTTIAGQLFISMWAERWVEACPEIKFLQTNTDGQTIMVPRKDVDKIRAVNEQLTKETTLTIEEAVYSKMCIRDVNNYLAVYEDSTKEHEHVKEKGDYEVYKEFHKDPSMRVVPLAVKNYFVYGIPIEETIKSDTDIFDFCMQLKTNSSSVAHISGVRNGELYDDELNRMTRYYMSTKGGGLYKKFNDGRIVGVNVGKLVTIFNKFEDKPFQEYNVDYNFYITEAEKLRIGIETGQLELF